MAKFCPQCGKEAKDKNKFCSKCGTKLDLETHPKPSEPMATPYHSRPYPTTPPSITQSKKSNKKVFAGVLSTVIIVIILIILLFVFVLSDGETTGVERKDNSIDDGSDGENERDASNEIELNKFVGTWQGGPEGEPSGKLIFTMLREITIEQEGINELGFIDGTYDVVDGKLVWYLADGTYIADYSFSNYDTELIITPITPPGATGNFIKYQ